MDIICIYIPPFPLLMVYGIVCRQNNKVCLGLKFGEVMLHSSPALLAEKLMHTSCTPN